MADATSTSTRVARVREWFHCNGDAGWPGEDQCVIDETTPGAPLLRADVRVLLDAYDRLRRQNLILKRQRDDLAKNGASDG